MIVDKAAYNTTAYPTSQYTRLGEVAVPGTHNVYGDGSCGVVSQTRLNPEFYGKTIVFSGHARNEVASMGRYELSFGDKGKRTETYKPGFGLEQSALVPIRQQNPGFHGTIDIKNDLFVTWYTQPGIFNVSPSPYHHAVEYGSDDFPEGNRDVLGSALGDFNGLGNTCGQLRFTTAGTNPGDWYVPALGELWYTCARLGVGIAPILSSTKSDIGAWMVNPSPIIFTKCEFNINQTYPFLRVVS